MTKIRLFLLFNLLFIILFNGFSQINNEGNKYYFPGLFDSFKDEHKIKIEKEKGIFTKEQLVKEGMFYFQTAINAPKGTRGRLAMMQKAVDIYNNLWRLNRSDSKITLLLGYAYMGLAAIETNLEDIIKHVFRARNMYSIVIDRLPENIDARLARAHININLSPQTGRPDDILVGDALVFIDGYNKLPEKLKENVYFLMGINIMRLALAVVYYDQGKKQEAKKYFIRIDRTAYPANDKPVIAIYDRYRNKIK